MPESTRTRNRSSDWGGIASTRLSSSQLETVNVPARVKIPRADKQQGVIADLHHSQILLSSLTNYGSVSVSGVHFYFLQPYTEHQ